MEIYPVTIRFLDPPLHEFLPHTDEEIRQAFEDYKNGVFGTPDF